MRTLEDNVIIYDAECPLCHLYTNAFVRTGMLDTNGREAYSCLLPETAQLIDLQKARNEIALVDRQHQTVTYGIDSLFRIIGHSFPLFQPLFSWKPFRWLMQKLYAFVSYNRKVIIPGRVFEAEGSCVPDFNLKYRWAFIVVAWVTTSLVLNAYVSLLAPLVPPSNFWREFAICGGQLLFQSVAVAFLRKDRIIHYLGNMMAVSLGGALLLLPALCIASANLISSPFFYAAWFAMVVGLMLLEHMRRVRLLGIHWSASASWIVYRLLVLGIIL